MTEIPLFNKRRAPNNRRVYSAANDPETANDPRPEMIPKLDRKWSPTANDPQTGPQMIPVKRKEWRGQQNGKDRGMLWKVELFSLLSLKAHFDLINY